MQLLAEHQDYSGAADDEALVKLWLADRPSNTRRAYRSDAGRFLAFLAGLSKTIRTATLADVQAFVDGLAGSAATKARRISAIKSLLSLAHRTGFTRFNVGRVVRAPKRTNKLAERILTQEDTIKLINAAKPGRDQVLVRLLYVGALRVSEACALRWEHVHPRDNGEAQLTVHGKGGKTRHVLITPKVTTGLGKLRGDAPDHTHVFLSRTGRPLHPRDARRIVTMAARVAGLKKQVTPHWLRHAHASHSLDRGAPIQLVSATLGHSSIATTGGYSHARPNDCSSRYLGI